MSLRLAVVLSHPIQYYSPWFSYVVAKTDIHLRVFYLWDFGVRERFDPGFNATVRWDVSLLDGHEYEFVENVSRDPGTDHFRGLVNPTLSRRIHSFRPEYVLQYGYTYSSHIRLMYSRRLNKTPFLFRGDSHILGPRNDSNLRNFAKRMLFKRFSAFLAVGRANRDYFSHHGVPESRIFHAPHSIDHRRFAMSSDIIRAAVEFREKLGIPADRRVVLFAGKFEPKKRPLELLEAFSRLSNPSAVLLFVGSGELERELKEKSAKRRDVFFAPFQNQSSMPSVYAAGDLFVLPSFGCEETWGLAVNEAMCLGRPVIVSDHVGCSYDLVQDGVNGHVYTAGDINSLEDKLRISLQENDLNELGRQSLQIIRNYDYAATTTGLLTALEYVSQKITRRGAQST